LSKLQFNFAHFIGPILTLRGPAPFDIWGEKRKPRDRVVKTYKNKTTTGFYFTELLLAAPFVVRFYYLL
jgi:hypothetical protein